MANKDSLKKKKKKAANLIMKIVIKTTSSLTLQFLILLDSQ